MIPYKKFSIFCLKMSLFFRAVRNSKYSELLSFNRLSHKQNLFCHRLYSLYPALSIIILFAASCQSNQKETSDFNLSLEEKVWLTQFFEDIMLFESGIYTLWGSSKPLTMIAVEQYSDVEKKAFYDSLTEEEKNAGIFCMDYSLDKTWFQ